MKDLSFINSIIQNNIDAVTEKLNSPEARETETTCAYYRGAQQALERTREDIKNFIQEANKLAEKRKK